MSTAAHWPLRCISSFLQLPPKCQGRMMKYRHALDKPKHALYCCINYSVTAFSRQYSSCSDTNYNLSYTVNGTGQLGSKQGILKLLKYTVHCFKMSVSSYLSIFLKWAMMSVYIHCVSHSIRLHSLCEPSCLSSAIVWAILTVYMLSVSHYICLHS